MSRIRSLLVFFLLVAGSVASVRADVIDRIYAVVNGTVVLQTDVTATTALHLLDLPAEGDRVGAAINRLIERQLILREVNRYGPPEPSAAEITRRLAQVDERVGSAERLTQILTVSGFGLDQLRRYLRDDLRIESYLQQRFGAAAVTDDQALQYYQTHQAEFTSGGKVLPFTDVLERARAASVEQDRDVRIRDWVNNLRRRADISVLYVVQP